MDSWEVLACEEQGLSKPVVQSYPEHNANRSPLYSRLIKLEYLSWPQIPVKTAHLLAHKYPKVAVNPKSGLCPEHADPATAVDQSLILSVAPFWEPEQLPVCSPTYALLYIHSVACTCLATHTYQNVSGIAISCHWCFVAVRSSGTAAHSMLDFLFRSW